MRIVVNDYRGLAPQVQLSRALAARGHEVLHLYCSDVQSPKADLRNRSGDPPTLSIEGLTLSRPAADSFVGRRRQEAAFGRMTAARISAFRPDVTIACNNPLDVQRGIQAACLKQRITFIYWMQEFYAAGIDRQLANGSAIFNVVAGSYYHWLERTLLHRSDAIVVVADDYLGILAGFWDVYDRQCMVVRHWSPIDAIRPRDKDNEWSRAHGLAGLKVAMYTGALGSNESPPLLIELARRIEQRSDAAVVVVSEGEGASFVRREAKSQRLGNLHVLPFQPYEAYEDVLATADVLLAMVEGEAGSLFVPSKISSYLSAARPIVMAAPWNNIAAQTIRESAGGQVVAPDDPASMSDAVLGYFDDGASSRSAGIRARLYAERVFDIDAIADRFERLFERLRTGPKRSRLLPVMAHEEN